jgi:hypothetical protein
MPNIPRYLPCWLALAVALTGSFTAGAAQEGDPAALRAVDSSRIDPTCSPCEDFFRFANGAWVDRTEIPARYTVYGVGREIQDRNEAILRRIVAMAVRDAESTADADVRRVGLFYATCMDSSRANRERDAAPSVAAADRRNPNTSGSRQGYGSSAPTTSQCGHSDIRLSGSRTE